MNLENRPLISVIVPVYKVEKYINQCVESILEQTFSDFELILVDDGSPDNCGAICDEYARKDPRVKVIHKENGGLVSARRAGYEICTGHYVANVDGDDYIVPDLLMLAAEQIRAQNVDAVLFGYVRFDENREEPYEQGVPAGLYDGKRMDIIRKNLILGAHSGSVIHNGLCAVIMRKERIDPYFTTFPKSVCRGEDLIVTAPALSHCGAVYVLDKCVYYYRVTPGSIMNTHRGDELDQAIELAEYLQETMGQAYAQRLDSYILLECFEYLSYYRGSWRDYKQEVSRVCDERLRRHLRGARCGKKTSIPNRVVFFLLRNQLFDILWLIWRIKGKAL